MVALRITIISLIFFPLFIFSRGTHFFPFEDPVIAQKGYHGKRYFGDLLTEYTIAKSGKAAICTLYVSTVFVGIETLNATNPSYHFDAKAGNGATKGTITINLVDSPLVSKLNGNFWYTVSGNNTSFTFQGDLIGWYTELSKNE